MYMTENSFSVLEKKEDPKAFLEAYLARKEGVLSDFTVLLENQFSLPRKVVDYSPESLITIWRAVKSSFKEATVHPERKDMPLWYYYEFVAFEHLRSRFSTFDAFTLKLIDGLSYYLGETIIATVPNAYWTNSELETPYKGIVPIVSDNNYSIQPLSVTIIRVGQSLEEFHHNKDLLKNTYDHFVEYSEKFKHMVVKEVSLEEEIKQLPASITKLKKSDPMTKDGFNYFLWLNEGAEHYLGTAIYERLPQLFSEIDGVEKVLQEDREVYYFKIHDIKPTQLKKKIVNLLLDEYRKNPPQEEI
jgi:hypothetical protein